MKTEGPIAERARARAKPLLVAVEPALRAIRAP
jgi:hypothetical protein